MTVLNRRRWGAVTGAVLACLGLALLLWMLVSTAQAEGEARPPSANPATDVSGPIVTHTTWTKAGSPYTVTGNVVVAAGITLTIEPGVEVRVQQSQLLIVNGALSAVGTAAEPITFTGTTPQPAWWFGLRVEGTPGAQAEATLDHVTVEYGGSSAAQGASLFVAYGTATVRHSLFRHGGQHGVYTSVGGVAHLSDTSLLNFAGYPIYFLGAEKDSVLHNITASSNVTNAIAIAHTGNMTGTHTWEALGLPYHVLGGPIVGPDALLTVEPGVEVRFASNMYLEAEGTLAAVGTAAKPITFTGTTAQPGWWQGLRIWGTPSQPARATLDYVTVQYGGIGGAGANVSVDFGQVSIAHSLIRHSGNDGLRISNGTGASVIEISRSENLAGYGVRNLDTNPSHFVLAANNWWGAASGPQADNSCNPGGTGSRVTARVAFMPFRTGAGTAASYTLPAQAAILTITPQRWFVPADGLSRVWVTLRLTDGAGQPLPGRETRLTSSRGSGIDTIVDGGITNVKGEALAYVTSNTAGNTELVGLVDDAGTCEFVRAPAAQITFTAPDAADALMAEGEAPYMNGRITVDPLPVTRGVSTTIKARVTNPYSVPITINGQFGIAQAGIGLTFGPLGSVNNLVIPPNSDKVVTLVWVPPIAGHYCVQFTYTWGFAAGAGTAAPAGGGGSSQLNLSVYPGPMGSPGGKASLATANTAFKAVSKLPGGHPIPKAMIGRWWGWASDSASTISKNLGGDPPRQDYRTLSLPQVRTLPAVQAGQDGISANRAAAINSLNAAMMEFLAIGEAAALALDRYAGASEAGDLIWASQQAAAMLYYQSELAGAAATAASRIDALLAVLNSEGVAQATLTAADIAAYQQRLATQGFNAEEIADAHSVGLTDEQLEALRLEIIAADPAATAGDMLTMLADEAEALRALAASLPSTPNFSASVGGAGSQGLASGLAATSAGDSLVRVFESTAEVRVGNPLAETAQIDLRLRRVDLPADWTLEVSPSSVTLAPGAQVTVTVRVQAGSAAVQGTQPRLAVEGYAGSTLIGGVTIDLLLPNFAVFDGTLRVLLPFVRR